jgi:hypothetical protein
MVTFTAHDSEKPNSPQAESPRRYLTTTYLPGLPWFSLPGPAQVTGFINQSRVNLHYPGIAEFVYQATSAALASMTCFLNGFTENGALFQREMFAHNVMISGC